MSFADELRQTQQSAQQRRKSDLYIYQAFLRKTYEYLKGVIRDCASKSRSNIVSGEYYLHIPDLHVEPEHKESMCHITTSGEDGLIAQPRHICEAEVKSGFITPRAKVSLTQFGRKLTDDLVRLGKADGISIWFTPLFDGVHGKQSLSQFDTFKKLTVSTFGGSGRVVIHYRIAL